MSTIYKERIVMNRTRAYAMSVFVSELVSSNTFPGIIFVKELAHANLLSEVLTEVLGVEVPAVSSQVPQKTRDEYLERMRRQDASLPVCVATTVWSTGVDVPALRWGLVAGAGKAPIGLRQQAGRLTRTCEGKANYTLYHWMDTGEGMEAYERQGEAALEHYARSGFNIAGRNGNGLGSLGSAGSAGSMRPELGMSPTGLLEQALDGPRAASSVSSASFASYASSGGSFDSGGMDCSLQTPGQQLTHAMSQTPEGFVLLLVFYALCGVGGFALLLALLRLLLLGIA